jgi:5-carboxymethyl-2-hydroxymuconate isomerase
MNNQMHLVILYISLILSTTDTKPRDAAGNGIPNSDVKIDIINEKEITPPNQRSISDPKDEVISQEEEAAMELLTTELDYIKKNIQAQQDESEQKTDQYIKEQLKPNEEQTELNMKRKHGLAQKENLDLQDNFAKSITASLNENTLEAISKSEDKLKKFIDTKIDDLRKEEIDRDTDSLKYFSNELNEMIKKPIADSQEQVFHALNEQIKDLVQDITNRESVYTQYLCGKLNSIIEEHLNKSEIRLLLVLKSEIDKLRTEESENNINLRHFLDKNLNFYIKEAIEDSESRILSNVKFLLEELNTISVQNTILIKQLSEKIDRSIERIQAENDSKISSLKTNFDILKKEFLDHKKTFSTSFADSSSGKFEDLVNKIENDVFEQQTKFFNSKKDMLEVDRLKNQDSEVNKYEPRKVNISNMLLPTISQTLPELQNDNLLPSSSVNPPIENITLEACSLVQNTNPVLDPSQKSLLDLLDKITNEGLRSTNEGLRSTNEGLRSTKEGLRSTNEGLRSHNSNEKPSTSQYISKTRDSAGKTKVTMF